MLLGREEERLAFDRLLAQARRGRSGVLALVGEPGIGKTALLDYATERAAPMRVLRARGVESEAEVPFAGLAELLRPALVALDAVPEPQAVALAGALALGPGSVHDRFAVGAATLSLLTAFAEEEALALLVDDAHLLDGASAEALLFAARRLLADRIALLMAVREGEPSLLDGADLRVIHLAGLSRSAAEQLLGPGIAEETVDWLHRTTAGNPLALLELAPEAERLASLPGSAPLPLSTNIAAAFTRRCAELPEITRKTMLVVAASDGGDLALLVRAGLEPRTLQPAEEAGLMRLRDGFAEFVHPLVRSAVYTAARLTERREAHAVIARALSDRDVDRRAWHLAAASVGPSAQAASALRHAGERALERSAFGVASSAFERGARLAPAADARCELLFRGADAAWLAGSSQRTLDLLAEARSEGGEPVLTARIDHLRGHVTMRLGPVMEGYALVVAAVEEIAAVDPEQAAVMLAEAAHACFYAGETKAMVAAGERAVALAGESGSSRATFFASMARGMAYVADGRGDAGAADVRDAIAILEASDELEDEPRLLVWAAFGPMYLREDAGRQLIDRAFERARKRAALGSLPLLLAYLARDQATSDQWKAAEVSFDEAIRLGRETNQRTELALALSGLAQLEARQGREEPCREHAAQAEALCSQLGMPYHRAWTLQALGDLELSLGRPEAAVTYYERQAAILSERSIADVDVQPGPELAEALLRLGRTREAATEAERYMAQAEAKGQPWALARAWRCRGLLATAPKALARAFERSLELHARTPDGFEGARTRLAYGARLRRGRQRVRAREELRGALARFERLGARAWADLASTELAATGETARRRDASTLDQLTPQELQIARLLAGGKTTREAASAVFLSPKTVEYHLGHVYQKLGIHSREELADAFRAGKLGVGGA